MDIEFEARRAGINPVLFARSLKFIKKEVTVDQNEDEKCIKPLVENPVRKQVKSYNLRSVKRSKVKRITRWIPRRSKDCFRDPVLTEIDTKSYHLLHDHYAKKLVASASSTLRSQVDKFVHDSKAFVVISWLTTARIYEYDRNEGKYYEVKRIPSRFIPISPNLITSLHYNNGKFYIAHLWGCLQSNEVYKPYIEIRDIYGKLLCKPHHYDNIVKKIHSDQNFVYVMTNSQEVFIHRKDFFNCIYYRVDFSPITDKPLIDTFVIGPTFSSYTKLPMLTAISNKLILSVYDAMDHRVCIRFGFKNDLDGLVSIEDFGKMFCIHRNNKNDYWGRPIDHPSVLDFGFFNPDPASPGDYKFTHTRSLSFAYHITQMSVQGQNLYLFGSTDSGDDKYEIGCLSLTEMKPLWHTKISNVNKNCQILVHSDNIAIIKPDQELTSIRIPDFKDDESKKRICKKCEFHFATPSDKSNHEGTEHLTIFTDYVDTPIDEDDS